VGTMLVGFRLVLRKTADGRLLLTVPLHFRVLLAAIGALVLALVARVPAEDTQRIFVPQNTLPLIFAGLALLGAAYHERWIFDKPGDAVVHRFGLAWLQRSRSMRISRLQGLVVERFLRGRPAAAGRRSFGRAPLSALSLRDQDGRLHRLETYGPAQRSRLEATSGAIAEYCGIPLLQDPPGS